MNALLGLVAVVFTIWGCMAAWYRACRSLLFGSWIAVSVSVDMSTLGSCVGHGVLVSFGGVISTCCLLP